MLGKKFGLGGNRIPLPSKPKNTIVPPSVMTNYQTPTPYNASQYQQQATVPQGITNQLESINKIPVGYTPEQELAMRNRIRSTDTAQNAGATSKLRDYMAARGLTGSGKEMSEMSNLFRGQGAARQGALSNLDISNAQLANQNIYQRAGMANQLVGMGEQGRQFGAGLGENARQFDIGQGNQMFQYGTTFDEQKRLAEQGRNDYYAMLNDWKKQLGLGDGGSRRGLGG